jgi:hypothetical protein
MLAVVAVVVTYQQSSGLGNQRLHDRYLFYLVPLWLIVVFKWFHEGRPRSRWAVRIGVGLALVSAAVLPLEDLDVNDGAKVFSAVGTGLPAIVGELVEPAFVVGRLLLVGVVAVLLVRVFRGRRPLRSSLVALGFVFVVNASIAWGQAFSPPEGKVWAASGGRRLGHIRLRAGDTRPGQLLPDRVLQHLGGTRRSAGR